MARPSRAVTSFSKAVTDDETMWVNVARSAGAGRSSSLLGRHFAGRDTIEHPDPGGKVIPVARLECQLAQVQTTALIFVVTVGAVLVEELRPIPLIGASSASETPHSSVAAMKARSAPPYERCGMVRWKSSSQPFRTDAAFWPNSDVNGRRAQQRRYQRGGQRLRSAYFCLQNHFQWICIDEIARCRASHQIAPNYTLCERRRRRGVARCLC